MLSRVAESLYWTARYVERAEDVTRLLDVSYHALLDAPVEDHGRAWRQLVTLLGEEERYGEHYDDYLARSVTEFLLWHPENSSAVAACIVLAQENARSVREQISAEMWQAVNALYLLVRGANRAAVTAGPHAFFERLRNGAHLFQGTVEATMIHSEAYEFVRLGLHLERAKKTLRVVDARTAAAAALEEGSPEQVNELVALLRSCGAFEAYLKERGKGIEIWPVADYLLRSPDFPRSVLHCVRTCLAAVSSVTPDGGRPHRLLGRIAAELEYAEATDFERPRRRALLWSLNEAGEAITRTYFSSQAILPGALSVHQDQQQQCG